jgi:nucleoside-diphosphate-sugar epimerase
VATHSRQDFVDVNITGTLNLLEEAARDGVTAFVYTSTTSVFGYALIPPPGAPAAWITEDVRPVPKNIYGVTKAAAEDLCQLFARNHALATTVLRVSRFFPEADDDRSVRDSYADANAKTNELLYRRVDIEDVVSAHLLAADQRPPGGFARYIISATTPFARDEMAELRQNAPRVVARHVPAYETEYAARGWRMFESIDRVYVNAKARRELGWQPRHDFAALIARLGNDEDIASELARAIGRKGYHDRAFGEKPYPL